MKFVVFFCKVVSEAISGHQNVIVMRRLPSRLQRRDEKSVVGVCAIAGGFPAGGGLQNGLPFLDGTGRERLYGVRVVS